MEFSFNTSSPANSSDEKIIYLNNDMDKLELSAELKIDSGEVIIQVLSSSDDEIVWSGSYQDNSNFTIELYDVKANNEYLLKIETLQSKDVSFIVGYESIKISYGDCLKNDKPFDEKIEAIKKFVLDQVNGVDFSIYDDILFVSKSLGTVISGWLADILKIKIRHRYLTPVEKTLQFIKNDKNISIIIAGRKDKFMDAEVLKTHCEQEQINLELIDDVGHRLPHGFPVTTSCIG